MVKAHLLDGAAEALAAKINADFRMLATGVNLARLATLGLRFTTTGWAVLA
ncbi:MAG: hypothetical protein ACRDUW_03490 [Pseudonocardiaceae bacterium]